VEGNVRKKKQENKKQHPNKDNKWTVLQKYCGKKSYMYLILKMKLSNKIERTFSITLETVIKLQMNFSTKLIDLNLSVSINQVTSRSSVVLAFELIFDRVV